MKKDMSRNMEMWALVSYSTNQWRVSSLLLVICLGCIRSFLWFILSFTVSATQHNFTPMLAYCIGVQSENILLRSEKGRSVIHMKGHVDSDLKERLSYASTTLTNQSTFLFSTENRIFTENWRLH